MSIISGDNVTYTADDLLSSEGGVVERIGLTADSTDVTPTGTLISNEFGNNSGQTFAFKIFNNTAFKITLTVNTGMTMIPGPEDIITAGTVKDYTVIVTSATTCNIYNTSYSGTPITSQQLSIVESGAGSNTVTFEAPVTLSSSYVLTFPIDTGSSGQYLSTDGTGILAWTSGPGAGITSLNGLTDSIQTFSTGTTGTNFGISSVGSVHTFNIPDASATARGLVTNSAQTFAGNKTFSGITMGGSINLVNLYKVINAPLPTASGELASKAYVDSVAGGDPGGVTDSVQYRSAGGGFDGTADFLYNDTNKLLTLNGKQTLGVSSFSGTPSFNGSQLDIKAQTYTDNTGGPTTTNAVFTSFAKPTLNASSATTTTRAATVYIAGGPISGTNETIINNYALWIDEGLSRFDENIDVGGNIDSSGTIQATTLTDGTGTLTSGNFTNLASVTSSTISDGVASMNSGTLTGLLTPINSSDAANKAYVDSVAFGLSFKDACVVATTNNITLTGLQTVDGVSVQIGNRVLVKDQTNQIQNGIYIANSSAWTRSSDLPNGSDAAGAAVLITQGTTQANSGWVCNNDSSSDTVGTDPLSFVQFSGTGTIVAGEGLSLTGNTLDVNVDDSTIEIVSDNLRVKTSGITSTQIADNAVITQKIPNAGITNVKLANDSIVITAGDGLQNGGTAVLGSSISIDVDSTVVRTTGGQSIAGIKTFTDTTQSFSSSTGSVLIEGGLGIKKDLFSDGRIETLGTIQGAILTDGTITITGGNISNVGALTATSLTATGTVTGSIVTDGTAIMTGGSISSLINLTASGTINSTNITDGTATLSGGTLTGLITPVSGSDAANKAYVDSVASGLIWKSPARVATTANITLSGTQTIDGIGVVATNRVLVKNQTTQVQNGIYVVAAGAWSRSGDMSSGSAQNFAVLVEEGTIYSGSGWTVTGTSPYTINTSNILWTQFSSTTTLSAGNGLSIAGNTINVNYDNTTLGLTTNTLEVKDLGITSAKLATNSVISSKILDNAITTSKILNANVTNAKLASSTIGLTVGTSGTNIAVTGSPASLGSSLTLNIPNASATARGVVTTATQTFGGAKTFNNNVTAVGILRSNNRLTLEDPGAGTTTASIQAASSTATYTLTLPNALASAANQVLTSSTAGILSWESRGYLQYDAIVSSTAGEGDYTTISAAVTAGAISIFVKEGTYNETTTISFPPNAHIIGENKTTTIINFGATAGQLILQPTGSGLKTGGTIAANNGSATVTGTGTTFNTAPNALLPGDFILIGDSYHRILSVASNTSLTLETAYEGPTLSGQVTTGGRFVSGSFTNFTVRGGSTNSLLTLRQCINTTVDNIGFLNSTTDGLEIIDSSQILVSSCVMSNCSSDGISMSGSLAPGSESGCTQINITQCIIKNNGENGIHVISNCNNIIIDAVNITNSGGGGENNAGVQVESVNNTFIQITDSICNYNQGKGINTESGSGQIVIQSCTCAFNSLDGIDYDGVFNVVNGCTLSNNGRYGIRGGQNGVLASNAIANNASDGMSLEGDNNCIGSGCQIRNNGGHGIGGLSGANTILLGLSIEGNALNGVEIVSGGSAINIVCCEISNNTGTGINISGTSSNNTITSNSVTDNNIGIAIAGTSNNNTVLGSTIINNTTTNILNSSSNTTVWALGPGNENIIREIVNILNNTVSTTTANGALVVSGGVGIGGALNVGGQISAGSNKVVNVSNPTAAQDAVTKNYLDNYSNILFAYDSVGGQDLATNPTIRSLTLGTVSVNTSSYGVTQVNGGAGVNNDYTYFTFPVAGFYEITYWLQFGPTGGANRATGIGQLEIDTGGGTTFATVVSGSRSACYMRSANTTWSGCGKTIFLNVTNTITRIRVSFYRDAATDAATVIGCSSISLKFIKP